MTELSILPGRCRCGHRLDLRNEPVDGETPELGHFGWLIFGYCHKCKIVVMLDFLQTDRQPRMDLDYIIREDERCVNVQPFEGKEYKE
jgi:hypothetical protein